MKKEKYISPTITLRQIASATTMLEGSIKAEGTDITDVDTDQDPFGAKRHTGFDTSTFKEETWKD